MSWGFPHRESETFSDRERDPYGDFYTTRRDRGFREDRYESEDRQRRSKVVKRFMLEKEEMRGEVAGNVTIYEDDKNPTGRFYAVVPVRIYGNNGKSTILVPGLNGAGWSKSRKKIEKHLRFNRISGGVRLNEILDEGGPLLGMRESWKTRDTYRSRW